MKKKYGLVFLIAMLLSSCTIDFGIVTHDSTASKSSDAISISQGESSFSSDLFSSSEAGTSSSEKLSITEYHLCVAEFPITEYYQYDHLKLDGIVVQQEKHVDGVLVSSEKIKDYTLYWEDGTTVADKTELTDIGTHTITVKKENCINASFDITVKELTDFREYVSCYDSSGKSEYLVGDVVDFTEWSVMYRTEKDSATGESQYARFLSSDEYTLYFCDGDDETELSLDTSYSLDAAGEYEFSVVYQGRTGEIRSYFTITVLSQTVPQEYEDDTIEDVHEEHSMTVKITDNSKEDVEGDKGYYAPEDISEMADMNDYYERSADLSSNTPTTGKVPLLIVPVVFKGDEKYETQENWDLIEKAFFGKSDDLYYESLRSYYLKSSYGQLEFTGTVTDYFEISDYDSDFSSGIRKYDAEDNVMAFVEDAWDWAKDKYSLDQDSYDIDDDGYVDGIWLVYVNPYIDSGSDIFWAFSSSMGVEAGTKEEPVANLYGWSGISFLTDDIDDDSDYAATLDNHECDAHVLIHETGHLLGLNDYYSYASTNYGPVGMSDMMCTNFGDQDPYSKMMLGWVKPYIAYNSCEITISSCQEQNNLIVIPYDDKEYLKDDEDKVKFNPFDEYLVLDLYTCENLNIQGYDLYDAEEISATGGRLYHVDNRLLEYDDINDKLSFFSDPDDPFFDDTDAYMYMAITNSESGSRAETKFLAYYNIKNLKDGFDEIRWITADKTYLKGDTDIDQDMFFDTGDSFSLTSYSGQFYKSGLDCGKTLSKSFSIESIN